MGYLIFVLVSTKGLAAAPAYAGCLKVQPSYFFPFMTNSTTTYQNQFFRRLEQKFSKRKDMVNAIGEVLHVGRDAVYRRLRGDTALTADEMMQLANRFGIVLRLDNGNRVIGDQLIIYPSWQQHITSEVVYFANLARQVEQMAAMPDAVLDYATPELPLYYELMMPTLLAFKTYVYGQTSWNIERWAGKPFHPSLIDPAIGAYVDRILPVLFNLPGREIWSVGILDVTLRQIEHAVEVGRLVDRTVIGQMFSELSNMIDHMEQMINAGKRFLPGQQPTPDAVDFRIYHNELTNTNNVILVKSPQQNYVFTTFVNPNYLISTNEQLFVKLSSWFDNLIASSNVMDVVSPRYHRKYFAQLRRTVTAAQGRVEAHLVLA